MEAVVRSRVQAAPARSSAAAEAAAPAARALSALRAGGRRRRGVTPSRRLQPAGVTASSNPTVNVASADAKSASLIDLFERAATPLGAQQRAEAALAAARAMGETVARPKEAKAAAAPAAAPRAAVVSNTIGAPVRQRAATVDPGATLDSVLGEEKKPRKAAPARGGGGGGGNAAAAFKPSASSGVAPGPDFWTWAPPTAAEPSPERAPQLAKAKAAPVRAAAEFKERAAEVALPPLQSDVEAPAWQEALLSRLSAVAPPEQSGVAVDEVSAADVSAALAGAAAALRHVSAADVASAAAPASGTLADGSRWWSESGVEEREGGVLCRWTVVRGVSADGATEWQEKWWEASDAWAYRELGAEKSGRDCYGRVWREAWSEVYDPDPVTGLGHIRRSADKWARDGPGATWHEEWREAFWADGRTERDAAKWGAVAPGVIPEDGHAGVWHEKWGERWDGKGAASKWTDKWAERAEREGGGQPRRWGDKWTQEFRDHKGGRWGETWSDDPGGAGGYSRKWSEDHYGDGQVRKWGQSSDGEAWEHIAHEDTWYETAPNFGWQDAYRHSPQLLNVPLRKRDVAAPGGGADEGGDEGGGGGGGGGGPTLKPPVRRRPPPAQ